MKFSYVVLVLVLCIECGICKYSNKTSRRSNVTPKDPHTKTIEYHTDAHTRKLSIPIMIHLDKVLTKNLTGKYKKTVKNYFRDVLSSVGKLFGHSSLNQTINFVLLDVKMLRNATKKFQMNENVSKYLSSYCQWQGEKKVANKKWYYSVLFTGLDVFYLDGRNNQVRSSTGRGYMRGICSIRNSCSLLEWHSENIAYIMAHEIAHSLGISHDGPPYNECRGQRYIMGPKYNPRNPATAWSPCNKRALEKFLLSSKSWCLQSNSNFKPLKI